MAILWKEEYTIGLETIDQQHRKFIDILNKLSKSFLSQDDRKEVAIVLKELEEYAENHFAFEEKYFRDFNYEDSEEHKKHHEVFRSQIQSFWEQLKNENELLKYDLLQFMDNWLTAHIVKEDKKYVECFRKNGIS